MWACTNPLWRLRGGPRCSNRHADAEARGTGHLGLPQPSMLSTLCTHRRLEALRPDGHQNHAAVPHDARVSFESLSMAAPGPAGAVAGSGGCSKPAKRNWQVELPCDPEKPGMSPGPGQGFCRIIDDVYERVKQIGEGTYGQVFLCRAKSNPAERVALKRIRVDQDKEGMPITALREMKLLFKLQHKNIICLKEVVRSRGGLLPGRDCLSAHVALPTQACLCGHQSMLNCAVQL